MFWKVVKKRRWGYTPRKKFGKTSSKSKYFKLLFFIGANHSYLGYISLLIIYISRMCQLMDVELISCYVSSSQKLKKKKALRKISFNHDFVIKFEWIINITSLLSISCCTCQILEQYKSLNENESVKKY